MHPLTSYIFVSDVDSFCRNTIVVKSLFHLFQCAVSAASLNMGTAVNDKNFHKIIFYMMQIYYFLTYHSESAYMEAAQYL